MVNAERVKLKLPILLVDGNAAERKNFKAFSGKGIDFNNSRRKNLGNSTV